MKYNSSFWYNDFETDDIIIDNLSDTEKKSLDLYKLTSSKRAISNFVNIVTNESIPVKFKERGDSYTDGKSVVIGSKIEQPKDFDVSSRFNFMRVLTLNSQISNYLTIYTT